jgi:hypothetical protein
MRGFFMRPNCVQACVLALSLMGCVTVPTLHGDQEDIANRIGDNAVAYNQAYGRAIANQILLNALRARDRLPLYYLSMSGISDSSYTDMSGQAQIGSIGLGQGGPNWGVGSLSGTRLNRTFPAYILNPFGGNKDSRGTSSQFVPITRDRFLHYWHGDWPRETLLYVLVDSATETVGENAVRYSNTSSAHQTCTDGADVCTFADVVHLVSDNARTAEFGDCPPAAPARQDRCGIRILVDGRTFDLELRSVDDMIYYLGSTLRIGGESPEVRPLGVYPTNPANEEAWSAVPRRAPLFSVAQAPQRYEHGDYAAEVTYRGDRYVAGPANNTHCIIRADQNCSVAIERGDASANVLSLITQLIIMSQSQEGQTAPRPAAVVQ